MGCLYSKFPMTPNFTHFKSLSLCHRPHSPIWPVTSPPPLHLCTSLWPHLLHFSVPPFDFTSYTSPLYLPLTSPPTLQLSSVLWPHLLHFLLLTVPSHWLPSMLQNVSIISFLSAVLPCTLMTNSLPSSRFYLHVTVHWDLTTLLFKW